MKYQVDDEIAVSHTNEEGRVAEDYYQQTLTIKKINYDHNIRRKFFTVAIFTFINSILFSNCNKPEAFKADSVSEPTSMKINNSKPNLVFLLLDDIGSEILSSYGGQSYETYNTDRLATEGMRFTQFYGSPLCSPSRFMLLTGKYNFRNYTVWGKMNSTEKTIATLLKDAGYETFVAGKWQFDGGDASIHSLGFNSYSVWLPFAGVPAGPHYKNPVIYENGAYLNRSETKGKFGDDIFTQRVINFIDSNKNNNFFVYDAITLSHAPFVPTPDDPEFADWTAKDGFDTIYFRSMVRYMDKKIGQITEHLKELGLYSNTIIAVAGDNGTSQYITSYNQGKMIKGGKGKTNNYGTKLPLIITWPKHISPGQINASLIDFTDFLPTIADAAGITIPHDYGIIDGKSFYLQLLGDFSKKRSWVFDHFQPAHENTDEGLVDTVQTKLIRWANTAQYKLYDSTFEFYNIVSDPLERRPLTQLTRLQAKIKDSLQAVINQMHN